MLLHIHKYCFAKHFFHRSTAERVAEQIKGCMVKYWLKRFVNCAYFLAAISTDVFRYYSATVDDILADGSCSVIFDNYKNSEVTKVLN